MRTRVSFLAMTASALAGPGACTPVTTVDPSDTSDVVDTGTTDTSHTGDTGDTGEDTASLTFDAATLRPVLWFDLVRSVEPGGPDTFSVDGYAAFVDAERSFSVGPQLWLVNAQHTKTMDRRVDPDSGQIVYRSHSEDEREYVAANEYDLEVPGDPDGLPPMHLTDVLLTVPAAFHVTAPSLQSPVVADRTVGFAYEWTPASTYPDAELTARIEGTLPSGDPGVLMHVLDDDGADAFSTEELGTLAAGSATFSLTSRIVGPAFGLPFSDVQDAYGTSQYVIKTAITLE